MTTRRTPDGALTDEHTDAAIADHTARAGRPLDHDTLAAAARAARNHRPRFPRPPWAAPRAPDDAPAITRTAPTDD